MAIGYIPKKDIDGRNVSRSVTCPEGWHYQPHWVEITTSKINGVYNKDIDENDLGFTTIKLYDSQNQEITTQENADINCVKTIVDWEPTHNYEIIAAKLFPNSPSQDIRVWVMAVPDVPAQYGGSKVFGQGGINLKIIGNLGVADTDGRSSKFMLYDSQTHTNKFRFILKHPVGYQHTFSILLEIYKE